MLGYPRKAYRLEASKSEEKKFFVVETTTGSTSQLFMAEQIRALWKLMNLSLVTEESRDPLSFHFDHCILAKQTSTCYPSQAYKPSTPFHLIHCNVCGPSQVLNLTGEQWFVDFIDIMHGYVKST